MSWYRLSATVFGLGKLPIAPGTWGTLAGIPLVFLFARLGPLGYMGATFLFIFYAILVSELTERQIGRHDASEIVIDEVAGYLITMTWLPINVISLTAGFFLFRLLDVLKPFPISYIDEKVKGGLGVVADDLLAGLVGNILLQVVYTQTSWLGS